MYRTAGITIVELLLKMNGQTLSRATKLQATHSKGQSQNVGHKSQSSRNKHKAKSFLELQAPMQHDSMLQVPIHWYSTPHESNIPHPRGLAGYRVACLAYLIMHSPYRSAGAVPCVCAWSSEFSNDSGSPSVKFMVLWMHSMSTERYHAHTHTTNNSIAITTTHKCL